MAEIEGRAELKNMFWIFNNSTCISIFNEILHYLENWWIGIFSVIVFRISLDFVFNRGFDLLPLKTFHRVIRNVDLCVAAQNIVLFTIVKSSCRKMNP